MHCVRIGADAHRTVPPGVGSSGTSSARAASHTFAAADVSAALGPRGLASLGGGPGGEQRSYIRSAERHRHSRGGGGAPPAPAADGPVAAAAAPVVAAAPAQLEGRRSVLWC